MPPCPTCGGRGGGQRQGPPECIDLYLGKSATELCPVKAVLNYLVVRGRRSGPLFVFEDGRYLTRQRLVDIIRQTLSKGGLDASKYCRISFRIGAATTAAGRGMEDSVIKTLGRWKSLAYLDYVKIPREQLAGSSQCLCITGMVCKHVLNSVTCKHVFFCRYLWLTGVGMCSSTHYPAQGGGGHGGGVVLGGGQGNEVAQLGQMWGKPSLSYSHQLAPTRC